jgi:ribonuclease HI
MKRTRSARAGAIESASDSTPTNVEQQPKLQASLKPEPRSTKLAVRVYVDGSCLMPGERVGYGAVVLLGTEIAYACCGPVSAEQAAGTRQVAGELFAAGHALNWCKAQGYPLVDVYYDYLGIEMWATGGWKAKQPITQRYQAFARALPFRILWHKVKSHTGDKWNDYVDDLAKRGAKGERMG